MEIVLSSLCLATVASDSALARRLLNRLQLVRRALQISSEQVEPEPDVPSEVVSSAPQSKGIGPKEPMQSSYLFDLTTDSEESAPFCSSDREIPKPEHPDALECDLNTTKCYAIYSRFFKKL
jgi:hypothetical protein